MPDDAGSSPLASTNWEQWTFGMAVQALTGDAGVFKPLDINTTFLDFDNEIKDVGKFGDVGPSAFSYFGFQKLFFRVHFNDKALRKYRDDINNSISIVNDLTRDGKRGTFDRSTLLELYQQLSELQSQFFKWSDATASWSKQLSGDDSKVSGTAIDVMGARLEQQARTLQNWGAELVSSHGGNLLGATRDAVDESQILVRALDSALMAPADRHGTFAAYLRNLVVDTIHWYQVQAHDYFVQSGLIRGTGPYELENIWRAAMADHGDAYSGDRVREYIQGVLSKVPMGVRTYNVTSASAWVDINRQIVDVVNDKLGELDESIIPSVSRASDTYGIFSTSFPTLSAPVPLNTSKFMPPEDDLKNQLTDPNDILGDDTFDPNDILNALRGGPEDNDQVAEQVGDLPGLDGLGGAAGTGDAGLGDLGGAGGLGDAGLGDAGLGDAGLGDAGLGDAGLGDAGLGDLGGTGGLGDSGATPDLGGVAGGAIPGLGSTGGLGAGSGLGSRGEVLGSDGKPILGANGEIVGADGQPILGDNGEILGPDGQPVLGSNGEIIGADGQPILGDNGEILGPDGEPVLGADGEPILGSDLVPEPSPSPDLDLPNFSASGGDVPTVAGTGAGNDAQTLPQVQSDGTVVGGGGDPSTPLGGGPVTLITGTDVGGGLSSSGFPMYPPMGGMGGMGGRNGGDDRERQTWLTEDEKVWGTSVSGVASVIGRPEDVDEPDEELVVLGPVRGARPEPRSGAKSKARQAPAANGAAHAGAGSSGTGSDASADAS